VDRRYHSRPHSLIEVSTRPRHRRFATVPPVVCGAHAVRSWSIPVLRRLREESRTPLDEQTQLLELGSVYQFQR